MAQSMGFEPTTLNREIAIRGLTPESLAEKAEVHRATVYRALRGFSVRPRSRERMLAALSSTPVLDLPAELVKAS